MRNPKSPQMGAAGKPQRRTVVVYETNTERNRAATFCEALAAREEMQEVAGVHWYSFDSLQDRESVEQATRQAATADLVVFATSPDGDFPSDVKQWIERWLNNRHEREGVLVGLVGGGECGGVSCLKEIYLRQAAHRGGMDYLSHAPPLGIRIIPDSLDSYRQRAGEVTSILSEILRARSRPIPPNTLR